MSNNLIDKSTPQVEGMALMSKYLSYDVLLDASEMQDLISYLGDIYLCNLSELITIDRAISSKEDFMQKYSAYVTSLVDSKEKFEDSETRIFSSFITKDLKSVYAFEMKDGKCLIKQKEPMLQMRSHSFSYNRENDTFHSMNFGESTIAFGVQFSYPQIFQDPKTKKIHHVLKEDQFLNNLLYKNLVKWMRKNTKPTPFLIDGKRKIATFRLGKNCFSWINSHRGLLQNKLVVDGGQNAH